MTGRCWHLSRSASKLREKLGKRPPFDELHRVVMGITFRADHVNRDDMRVVQARGSPSLYQKSPEAASIARR